MAHFTFAAPAGASRQASPAKPGAARLAQRGDPSGWPGWYDSSRELSQGLEVCEIPLVDTQRHEGFDVCLPA